MSEIDQLQDFNVFLRYGDDPDLETEHDLYLGVLQKKRSLYYDREDGCGISGRENYPNAALIQVVGAYDVMRFIAFRNSQVTDGRNNTLDRRAASSQNFIVFFPDGENLSVNVGYIPFANFQSPKNLNIPLS